MEDKIFSNVVKFMEKELKYIDENAINSAITHLNNAYYDLDSTEAAKLDFDDRIYRCGYVYRYFTCFTCVAKQALNDLNVDRFFENWLDGRSVIKLTSLGGGPGTDLLTFFLFLQQIDTVVEMRGVVLDLSKDWLNCLQYLFKYYDVWNIYKLSDVEYISFDFLAEIISEDVLNEIRRSDVVSMVKFVSSVGFDREFCTEQLTTILLALKPNAIVFFMDNSGGKYLELMTKIAKVAHLTPISQFQHKNIPIPDSELKEMEMCQYSNMWREPMKTCKVSAAIWRKPIGKK
uniref:Uncharacterized protein n=1 Tax=Strigamia maritima TaxID=126957 RepID=T1IKU4_STRMM